MKTDRLPPREKGLQPTHFIEVWRNSPKTQIVTEPQAIHHLILFNNTIAIFKIYPKHK